MVLAMSLVNSMHDVVLLYSTCTVSGAEQTRLGSAGSYSAGGGGLCSNT